MIRLLHSAGFYPTWERVTRREEYLVALARGPDVILADHGLPQFGAGEALRLAGERGVDVPLIVVSGTVDEAEVAGLLAAGATDYVPKGRLDRLGAAVRGALLGRRVWSAGADAPPVALTLREREVLRLVAHGLSNREIGHELGISWRTAKTHVSRILSKLGVETRIAAAVYAVRAGLANDER